MDNELLLMSKNDIPFIEAGVTIHQPTIREIAYLGEEQFYSACELLRISKDNLEIEDKNELEKYTNFDILMSVLNEKSPVSAKYKITVLSLLAIIFPNYAIQIKDKYISLLQENIENKIDNSNYKYFISYLKSMFCLNGLTGKDNSEYNPVGDLAKSIAEKLKKRHQKLAEEKKETRKVAILCRYVSILAVGENKDMNSLMDYTVYQLFDEFKRYELKMNWDIHLKAKLAGAQDLKEVDDWMKDIHSENEK